jgi:hypothetical protein
MNADKNNYSYHLLLFTFLYSEMTQLAALQRVETTHFSHCRAAAKHRDQSSKNISLVQSILNRKRIELTLR